MQRCRLFRTLFRSLTLGTIFCSPVTLLAQGPALGKFDAKATPAPRTNFGQNANSSPRNPGPRPQLQIQPKIPHEILKNSPRNPNTRNLIPQIPQNPGSMNTRPKQLPAGIGKGQSVLPDQGFKLDLKKLEPKFEPRNGNANGAVQPPVRPIVDLEKLRPRNVDDELRNAAKDLSDRIRDAFKPDLAVGDLPGNRDNNQRDNNARDENNADNNEVPPQDPPHNHEWWWQLLPWLLQQQDNVPPVLVQPQVIVETPPAIVVPQGIVEMPLDAAAPEADAKLPRVYHGETLTVFTERDFPQSGVAVFEIQGQRVNLEVNSIKEKSVTVAIPQFLLTRPVTARLYLANAEGEVLDAFTFEVATRAEHNVR